MHFNSGITVLATLLALAQSASCSTTGTTATDLTSSQVVTSIQSVTKISASLNVSVSAVSTKTTAADMATIATVCFLLVFAKSFFLTWLFSLECNHRVHQHCQRRYYGGDDDKWSQAIWRKRC
jgi:hypothetical protein